MRQLTTLELKLLFEALALISVDDSQDEFMQEHNMTQDEFDNLTIDLRCVIDAEINKREANLALLVSTIDSRITEELRTCFRNAEYRTGCSVFELVKHYQENGGKYDVTELFDEE